MKRTMRILFTLSVVAVLALAATGCTSKAKKAYHLSRANHYYDANQLEEADIEYMNVLRWDSENSQAYSRLGQISYDQGRMARARYFLEKGSKLSPDDLDLRLKLGFIYSSMGQFTQAVAQANFILDKNPKDNDAPILLAEASVFQKDADAARQRLQTMAKSGDSAAVEVALGTLALHERDVVTATAYYKKAQALDPKSPAVNDALAQTAWAQGDLKQAEAFFKAAADASPARSPRRMQYVLFKVQNGDLEGARSALTELLNTAPDYLPALMRLAEISATEKKYDECAEWLGKVQKLDPDNFDAMLFQGQLDMARGNTDQAIADMEQMSRLPAYSHVPQVFSQLAAAYLAATNLPKAAENYSRALELNPNMIDAALLLAQIQINSGNSAPAIISLEQLRKKQPRLPQAQLLLAAAYQQQQRTNDALAVYQSLESMYPTNSQVALLRGTVLFQSGDTAGARKEFEHILEYSPTNLPAIENLMDLDILEKRFDDAAQLVNRQMQDHPQQADLRLMQAKILAARGSNDQAEAVLTQVLTMGTNNLTANLLLSQLYLDTHQTNKALVNVKAALEQDPQNTPGLMLAAEIYEAKKDYKSAADMYETLLKIDPKYTPALNNLAYLYSEYLNNLDRAYELAQRAHELLTYDPPTMDTLGWVCFRKGTYQTALGLLQQSAPKLPIPEAQYHLGMAAYMTGDETTARTALQEAWRPGSDFHGRDDCGRALSILDVNPATADQAARTMLEKRVAEKPDDPVALVRLARMDLHDGNTDKAIAAYEAILQALPQNLDAIVNLSRLYEAKEPRKAYDMAKAASKIAPYNPEVSHALGRLAFASGDFQLATSALQQALQSNPNDASLLFDYARAAYSIGRISDAQAAFQSALAQDLRAPQSDQAKNILYLIALAASPSQASASSAHIDEALKSNPGDVPALMARAAASQFNSDNATVEQSCEKALARYPDFVPAEILLARLYANEPSKLDRAYAMATKAREAQPDEPEATKVLGIILVQRADYSHAASLLQQSAVKLNSDPEAYYYLGVAQFHLKNQAASKANLQQALSLKLSGPPADSAKQILAELK